MASPQLENGYFKIATELGKAFARIRISGEASQVLWVIILKTYGFHKKSDAISLSQFCLATGMSKTRVCKAISKLLVMNIITKKGNAIANIYSINKDFISWKPLPKKATVAKKGNNYYQKEDIQKIVLKDNNEISSTEENFPLKAKKKKMRNSWKYNESKNSDAYEDSIDLDSGEPIKSKLGGDNERAKIARHLFSVFSGLCLKNIKVKPALGKKEYSIIYSALTHLNDRQVVDLLFDWFKQPKEDKDLVQITQALSHFNINRFKVENKIS